MHILKQIITLRWDNWTYQSRNLNFHFLSINVLQVKPKIDYLILNTQSFNWQYLSMLFQYITLFFLFTWSLAWIFILPIQPIYMLSHSVLLPSYIIDLIHLDLNSNFIIVHITSRTYLREEGEELPRNLHLHLLKP